MSGYVIIVHCLRSFMVCTLGRTARMVAKDLAVTKLSKRGRRSIGSVAEKPPAKKWLIVLFAVAGLLFLAAWAMTNII